MAPQQVRTLSKWYSDRFEAKRCSLGTQGVRPCGATASLPLKVSIQVATASGKQLLVAVAPLAAKGLSKGPIPTEGNPPPSAMRLHSTGFAARPKTPDNQPLLQLLLKAAREYNQPDAEGSIEHMATPTRTRDEMREYQRKRRARIKIV